MVSLTAKHHHKLVSRQATNTSSPSLSHDNTHHMADEYRRPPVRRQPLTELPNSANTSPAQRRQHRHIKPVSSSPTSLPHNESLEPNGLLITRGSQPNSSEHKRLTRVANEYEYDSKRSSAISTTSTNASGRKRKAYIGHWQLGKTIGKGGCSRVRAVRHRYTQQYGAVKIIARATAESTRAQSLANLIESTRASSTVTASGYRPIPYGLEREIALMKLLEHKNIVQLYDVWENRNELYLIMEYVDGGELFHYVEQRRGLPEDETVLVFRQIIAALLYCHRLHICHRDLKPENILLNQDNLQVKLIDFGMAALQPEGRLLSTPCGSPHYAAPEVVSARPYDGKQADVWSCGVILYVMLTGTTPYNYSANGDIKALFRDIARARYTMPVDLSFEAKDLIRKIFVPDPRHRITMDGIWEHPLLHKYDRVLGLDGPEGSKENAIGPVPQLEDWTVKRVQDVDREILRNMRTLWHSEPEHSLIQKLLNKDVNQEKLFYAALVKHREENLENYDGEMDGVAYSASDYHHSRAVPTTSQPATPNWQQQQRSQSQYSILNDEHLRPSHSFVEPPPSMSSYDPYRASKDPIIGNSVDYVDVVVHRNSSNNTRRSARASIRQPNALRVELLKHGSRRTSNSNLARSARSRSSLRRSSMSRQSLSSSVWPSSPPVIASMKPSDVHKRGVSFDHIRRASATSANTGQVSTNSTPATPRRQGVAHTLKAPTSEVDHSSPTVEVGHIVRSRKVRAKLLDTPRENAPQTETPSQHIRKEIRKHSVELEKACQEAFFRSSVGSNTTSYSPFTEEASPTVTPPSSVSVGGPATPEPNVMKIVARPLPEPPRDTPNSYLTRTLEEFREKLTAYKSHDDGNTANFDEVMRMLNDLVPPQNRSDKRLTSAPDYLNGCLPIITEESDLVSSSKDAQPSRYRSVTAPVRRDSWPEEQTIRVVPPSSPANIPPLNIRKRRNEHEEDEDVPNRIVIQPLPHEHQRRQRSRDTTTMLEAIDENEVLIATQPVVQKKRSGWFGRTKKVNKHEDETQTSTMEFGADEGDNVKRRPSRLSKSPPDKPLMEAPPVSATISEFPIRKKHFVAGKKGFSKWFGKLGHDSKRNEDSDGIEETMFANTSLESLFSTDSPSPSTTAQPTATDQGRSWFARFLNIKPATKLLCFSIARGRARQELVILLKEWQRHGIRDLQYSRETNTITARVDKRNSLDIKPVAFRVELFIVLEHGRRVGLSIARFTQVKGAASGFKKVLDVVDGVMRGRGWLVEDEEKWNALCEIVDN